MKLHSFFGTVWILFILSLLAPSASAFAIAPGKMIIEFTPNAVTQQEILLINTEQQPVTIALEASGDLASYIQLSKTQITLAPDTSLTVPYTLRLPAGFPQSGVVMGMIIAHRAPEVSSDKTNPIVRVGAVAGVASTLQVNVPYHGRSLLATLAIPPVEAYTPVQFIAQAKNVGDETLRTVHMDVAIYDLDENLITTVSSEDISLEVNQRANLLATWDANVSYGQYHAQVTFAYDGREQEVAADFTIGTFAVELLDIHIEDFIFNSRATLLTLLKNKEAREITVMSEITLQDAQAYYLTSLDKQQTTLGPQQEKTVPFVWNLTDVPVGRYKGMLSFTVEDAMSEHTFFVELTETGITASLVPFSLVTGQVISSEPTDDASAPLRKPWIFWILLLVGVHILFFTLRFIRRKRQSNQQPPSAKQLPYSGNPPLTS